MRYITFVKMVEDLGDPPPALFEAMDKEMRGGIRRRLHDRGRRAAPG